MRLRAAVLGVLAAAVLETGCLVHIMEVRDPEPFFRQARAEASRYQGRPGPARELNVLVYDRSDRKLVQVRLPMWLVRKADEHVDWDEVDLDDDGEEAFRRVRRHVALRELEKAGPGILVEVDHHEEGEQVLVWLRE